MSNERKQLTAELNAVQGERELLEAEYGQVWSTPEVTKAFTIVGFCAPCVVAIRKSDKVKGTLMFQHNPRFYFSFEEE